MNAGEIALNGSMLIAIPVALLAGIITFVSPCVLPLVPGYLGYVSGSANSKTKVMTGALLFVLGFTAVFVSLGVLAGTAGLLFIARNPWIQVVLGDVADPIGYLSFRSGKTNAYSQVHVELLEGIARQISPVL